jgi:hypothetical protein
MKDKHPWRDNRAWELGREYMTRQQVTVWLRRMFRDALLHADQPGYLDEVGLTEAVMSALSHVLTERRREQDRSQWGKAPSSPSAA